MEPIFRFTLNTDTGEIKKTVITEYDYIEGNRWSSGVKNQPYYRYKYSGAYYYAYVHDFDRYINRRVYLWEDNIERVKAIMASSLLASIEEFKNKEEKYKKTLSLIREMDNYHAGEDLKTVEPTTKNDLEVDCISRADAIRVASGYCHPSNVAKELAKLPSVTPQEPRTKEYINAVWECGYDVGKGEQEPILDKIRAEIEQLSTSTCTETRRIYIDADAFKENVIAILDKYKADAEEV